MTPAEYRTIAESIGITQAFLAEQTGISVGRVNSLSVPSRTLDVPEHAADTLRDLVLQFDSALARVVEGDTSTLVRHADETSFWAAHPGLDGWPLASEGILLGHALAVAKGAATVVYA